MTLYEITNDYIKLVDLLEQLPPEELERMMRAYEEHNSKRS